MLTALSLLFALNTAMPPDVPEGHYAYAAVAKLEKRGCLHVYKDGLFRGARPASRYEAVWMVDETLKTMKRTVLSLVRATDPPDVPANVSATSEMLPPDLNAAIRGLSAARVLHVYNDGLFRGPRPVSKAELALMGFRLARITVEWDVDAAAQTDNPIADPKSEVPSVDATELDTAVRTLAYLKALPLAPDGAFAPNSPATRYDAAVMLAALADLNKS